MAEKTYNQKRQELDEIIDRLAVAGVDVDEAEALYKQGVKLIEQLEDHLKKAKNNIKQLDKK